MSLSSSIDTGKLTITKVGLLHTVDYGNGKKTSVVGMRSDTVTCDAINHQVSEVIYGASDILDLIDGLPDQAILDIEITIKATERQV